MGKIFTQKGINLYGLKAAMESVWGYPKGFKVMEVGGGIYQFVFGHEMDLLRVFAGSPWLYNNQLIVLQRWVEGVTPDEINFSYSPFWIQLRALPLEFMSTDVGRRMKAGFRDIEDANIAQLSGNQGRCVRVKVELDIRKPIPRGKKVYTADWKPIWLPFRYEKLPILCHYCGVVGHDDCACVVKHNEVKSGIVKETQYGGWLKASPAKISSRRRAEGRPDSSPAESSAERSSFGKTEDQGKDLHEQGNDGHDLHNPREVKNGRVGKVGQGDGSLFATQLNKSKSLEGPRSEPITLGSGHQDIVQNMAHSEGALGSPVQVMEVDQVVNNILKPMCDMIQILPTAKQSSSSVQGLKEAIKEKAKKNIEPVGNGVDRPKRSNSVRGYKRKLQRNEQPSVGEEKDSKGTGFVPVPSKRKCDGEWSVTQTADGINQSEQKKQKLGATRDEWEELIWYRQQSAVDWLIWGDFNAMLTVDEKQGGRRRETWSLKAFRDFVTKLEAVDLGYVGYPFTWANRRCGDGLIKERLDRALVSSSWRLRYERAKLQHLFAVGLDHMALLLDTNPPNFSGPRQFRFDNRWIGDPGCQDVVHKSWQVQVRGSKMFEVFHKVRNTRRDLRVWSKNRSFNARKKINLVQNQLKDIGEERVQGDMGKIRALEKELGEAWDSFGNWCEDQDAIAMEFVQYFQGLFQSEGTAQISEVVDTIKVRVTDQMNQSLTRPVGAVEIRAALFDMDPNKAPALTPQETNGMNVEVFWGLATAQRKGSI
ncbi:hypothetical protein Vadar_028349 [Vaccinium darrowii]|uniref:Uncharacterized protein n=1 Tax=Vaccinium darrowii TaxID=229202 RepID=A0ACB7Y9H0_9ERIC|nr:hypothetical protein Vadar_028349 [Vaccinium darrowii]